MSYKIQAALDARKSRKKTEEESFKEKAKKSQEKIDSALQARESRIKNNLQSTFSDLESSINTEIEAFKKLSNPSWGGGDEALKTSLESTRQNRINVDNLIRKVEAHRKYLGDEKADTLLNNLNGMKDTYNSHISISEIRSKYKSEEEYEKEYEESVKAQEDYEAMTTFDLEAGKKEIEDLLNGDEITALRTRQAVIKEQMRELGNQTKGQGFTRKQQLQKELNEVNAQIKEIENQVSSKKAYLNRAEYIQGGIKLTNDAKNAEDFDANNQYISTKSEGFLDRLTNDMLGFNDSTYEYINNVDGYREKYRDKYRSYSSDNPFDDGESSFEEKGYDYISEEEIKIYNYYYSTEGKEKAEEFLDSIQETLNYRKATKDFSGLEGRTFAEILFGVEAGLDQFSSGMKNLFNTSDDYIPSSATQMTSGMVREDLADDGFKILGSSIGQIGYDLTNTTANMLPSILTSTVIGYFNPVAGQIVGAGLMGASASGNAYAEMLNLGYDKGQARLYSGLVGASEATLQYLLGGIGKLGGGKLTTEALVKVVNNMDNAFARVAIKLGANALGEFTEEYLQEVLNPFFKNITLGTNEDIKLFSTEALYSGILGALSAGILETGSTISSDIKTTKLGKSVQKIDGGVERLKKLGTTFSADAVAHQIADKVTDETGAYKVGLLLQEVGGTLSEQNVSDITIELTKKGMDETTAKRLAKTYQAFLNKEMSLSDEQVETLEGLDPLADVLRKNIIGRNTSVYQRTREYSDLVKLAIEMETNTEAAPTPNTDTEASAQPTALYSKEYIDTVAKEFEANGFPAEQARILAEMKLSTPTETNSSPTEENAIESEFEVSADGKTINKNTDKIVNVKKIESISEGGEANLTLDDGMVVKASDLAYGNDAEVIFIENIGKIKLGKKNISTNSANLIYMKAMKALENNPKMTADEATSLIKGLEESYVYGAYNFSRSELSARNEDGTAKRYAGELSQEQRAFAYELGTQDSVSKAEADQKVIDELKAKAKVNNDTSAKTTAKKGSVRFENGVVAKGKNQKRAVSLAKHLARAIGIDIVFYDARTTKNPNGKDANGYFDEDTDTIYLDLQNSWSDAKTIAYTMSHELVHFIKKWSPAKFDTFAKFLMEQYGKHGVDASKLLSNKMTDLKTTDADLAYEEMVCDACETMLLDSNAIYKLMELRKTDLELFDKIKLHIHELLNKIRNMYKKLGLNPTSNEAKALLEMKDVLEQIYSMFEEAAVDAAQSYQAVSTLETESVSVSEDGTVMMQMKQYQQTGRATLLKYLKEQYGDADANNLIATIDNIYNTMKDIKKDETLTVFSNWQDSEVELDENGHPIFTTSINNGDYELNQDFSRVCKKRRQLDFVLNMLAEDPAFEASNLTKQDFVKINKAIKEHGFEIACALCFVDSKRFRQAEWADSFANTWNDILYSVVDDKSKLTPFNFATKNPNLADEGIDIDTSKPVMYRKWSEGKEDVKNRKNYDSFENMLSKDGKKWIEGNTNVRTIATLIRDNPNLRHTFRGADIIASQGFDTIQRLAPGIRGILDGWGGSSVPKPSSNDASYDSSIINMSGYNKETAYAMGGARMNSFSDFMAHMFFDYCQVFADLAAKELPSQAYTKELIYVRLFGRSGQKINMSGIAAIRDDALPTTAQKGVSKAEAEANEKIEKMVAGLDVSRLLEHLNKDIHQLTEADVEQSLDMCDYIWADESINMKHATLLQTGILYDKLSESKIEECYELLKAGEVEKALKVAGKANVDTEYAKHCGTIVVGVSDAHIRKLLRDPTVRMVIPYHKSGLNPIIARELRISAYNDYTLTQTTGVKRKGAKATAKIGSDEIKKAYGLKDFSFYDWFGKTIDGKVYDGKATADKYLEWCEKGYYDEKVGDYVYYTNKGDGYILAKDFHKKATIVPKFDAFMGEENYYKVLEDFDCYNTISGEHSEQGAVDFLRNGLPSDYKSVLMDALKAEQKVSDDFRDHLDNHGLKDEIMDIVKANGYKPSVKKQAKKVRAGMSEAERYSILKDAKIIAVNDSKSEMQPAYSEIEKVPEKAKGQVEKLIRDLADDLEILNVPLSTTALDIEFQLSKNNGLRESLSQQLKYGGNFHDFSKALINLRDILNRAILVEVHTEDRYKGTVREDINFEAGYVLFSAFKSQEYVIPVKLEIKQKKDVHNILYVVVSMTKIKRISVMESALDDTEVPTIPLSDTDSVYSLPHLVSKINPKDRGFLKYLPDQMLNTEQSAAKNLALKEDKEKLDAIPKKSDSVKKQIKKDSEGNTLSAEQIEYFKDSKARDKYGNLLVCSHNSHSNFTTFDKTKIGEGLSFGKGFYFYDFVPEKVSKEFGENQYLCYLNITNPAILDNINELSKVLDKLGYSNYEDIISKNIYGDSNIDSRDVFEELGIEYEDIADTLASAGYDGIWLKDANEIVVFEPNQIKLTTNTNPTSNPDIRYQKKKNSSSNAPTFYSQMGKVVEGVKQEKLAANSVVNMLRGKGVKAEEIRWSGIVPFLEGKKSVTKQELLDFINGSMLQIEEKEITGDGNPEHLEDFYSQMGTVLPLFSIEEIEEMCFDYDGDFSAEKFKSALEGYVEEGDISEFDFEDAVERAEETEEKLKSEGTRWSQYKLDGGTNYRELVFTLPNSTYTNRAMKGHWGQDAEGILVHARIQDFDVNGKKMLFIEELQSDWHNEGHSKGYSTKEYEEAVETHDALYNKYKKLDLAFHKYVRSNDFMTDPEDVRKKKSDWLRGKVETAQKKYLDAEKVVNSLKEKGAGDTHDAPFKETYHEYVLKRLLRMAAEQGYDSIGWTPSKIQTERWSDEYAEGYRIEYDQDMPKFLKKYGRQWGAKVGKTDIQTKQLSLEEEMDNAFLEDWIIDEEAGETEESVAEQMRSWKGLTSVWSMDITDSMKESVLTEGQPLFQKKTTSNRAILANALEGVAENDVEKNKLKEYKEKISLIESEEQRLSEIHQQLFTKGAVEPSQRKELQFKAKQIANRINTYDRQLLRLEATKPLQSVLNREKEMARKRQKQKDAEAMRDYKEKVAKTTRELLDRNRDSRKKAIESRNRTAMRHKIQSVVGDLNSLLLKPTKERHVPEEMRIAVSEALSIVNMDTVDADTRVAKYNDLIAKAKDPDVIASLTASRDRILEQGNKLSEKLSKLKEAYGMARDSADDSLRSMYDDVIYNKIESVQNKVGKTPIRNMTLEQLESVYELYKMVLTTVRDSNKAFAEDLKMTRQALGSNTFAEIKENNKTRDRIRYEFIEKFGWQNLKPMQAMKTIGSGTLQKLWNNILYGQEVFAQDYDEAVKFAKEMKDKYGYKKWNLKKLYSFESKSGKTMKISLEQMMSIYAYSKRHQADEHIEFGGIVLNEGIIEEKNKLGKTVKVRVNDSTAYRLDRMQVAQIIETLEKEAPGAKTFVDEMQKYLSETMGEKGNEVSMKMYGIRLFKEEHYFPLKSSKDFMEVANAKLKGDVKIKNKGMTKSTVEHARNPIVLENFLDVWGNHINEMAMYHGLVLPLEDFSRTLNYGFKADESLNTDAESVRTALHDAFGENADNYLNELLKAINGGVLHDSSAAFADKMISKFKKAKVMASLSVVVQQPTAIIRAMGIIEPKYFVAQNLHHKSTWEELKKYCPTAIIKETGSFDTNMGRTIVDMIKDEQGFIDKVGDVLGKAPAFMDEVGWNMIWRALKKKVAAEQKLSGETLLQECGKQMTLILNETQVYDSVMSRNELMRSKNALTKMATAFMAEPSTVANMIYGAALDFKRGKKGVAGKTVAAVISSVVVNGLVSAMVYALRDDDEDETLLEKYLSSATAEVLDGLNPLTYIPFIKDAWSLFQGYDVERTDMALIGDVVDAVNNFYSVLDPEAYEDMSKGEIAKHIYENSVPMLTSICDMFGLPVGNILRDAEAIIINDNVPMSQTSSKGIGYAFKDGVLSTLPEIVGKFIGTDSKQDKLYDAIVSGDTTYLKRLKSGYKDDKAYETAVRKALRENDSRIKEAAEARIDGNIAEYARIVKAIKAEGFFSQDTIVASVNAEINAINKGESSSSNSSTEDKASSIYKIDDYYASIMGGDQASAYVVKEDIINIDVANGKDRDEAESNFNSKFASYLREEYEKGNLSEQEAERMLVNYGDKSEEEAASKVQYWEFKQKYPDYDDLSEEAVTKYYDKVEPYGINIGVYYDYSKQRSKCKGTDANGDGKTDSGSVKTEVLRVINSLPISSSQKDALYYLNGWSAQTMHEAPWH